MTFRASVAYTSMNLYPPQAFEPRRAAHPVVVVGSRIIEPGPKAPYQKSYDNKIDHPFIPFNGEPPRNRTPHTSVWSACRQPWNIGALIEYTVNKFDQLFSFGDIHFPVLLIRINMRDM